jgi:tetratricopeptide (TPR) repeat protein
MVRLLIYSLSLFVLCVSCQKTKWYKKDFSEVDQKEYAQQILQGMLKSYYQGTPPAEHMLFEAQKYDSTNAAIWRELGVPYLKRGYYHDSYYYYDQAVKFEPETWQGYRGYNYLYFYRDFDRAIADFNATDSLTLDFTDYPQGQSVDYMRGIAYYGLGNIERSQEYLHKYINEITSKSDESWVDTYAFLYCGLGYLKEEKPDSAILYFDKLIKYNSNLSDGYFHKASTLFYKGELVEAKKLVDKAEELFKTDSFHKRPYIEVLNQIYMEDIDKLKSQIQDVR